MPLAPEAASFAGGTVGVSGRHGTDSQAARVERFRVQGLGFRL